MFKNLSEFPKGTLVYRVVDDSSFGVDRGRIVHQDTDYYEAIKVAKSLDEATLVIYRALCGVPDGTPQWTGEQSYAYGEPCTGW